MNRYLLIRRLRGPAFLLLVGVIALLAQANILSWGKSWPLFSDSGRFAAAGRARGARRRKLSAASGNAVAECEPGNESDSAANAGHSDCADRAPRLRR